MNLDKKCEIYHNLFQCAAENNLIQSIIMKVLVVIQRFNYKQQYDGEWGTLFAQRTCLVWQSSSVERSVFLISHISLIQLVYLCMENLDLQVKLLPLEQQISPLQLQQIWICLHDAWLNQDCRKKKECNPAESCCSTTRSKRHRIVKTTSLKWEADT